MRLNVKAMAITMGLVWGSAIFLVVSWLGVQVEYFTQFLCEGPTEFVTA